MFFVIETGLTRRLVEADDADDARLKYLYETPMRRHLSGAAEDPIVRPATDDDLAMFERSRRRRRKAGDDQLTWELGDVHKEKKRTGRRMTA